MGQTSSLRDRLGIAPGTLLALAFGGTRADKGCDLAIRALAHLPEHHHLLVAGPAETFGTEALRTLALECGVGDRVHLVLDYIPEEEVGAYFAAADCVVLPYRRKFAGQSGPLFIAAALGLPVVASDVGVLGETVRAYRLGLLFEPERPQALADALLEVHRAAPTPDTASFLHDHSLERFAAETAASYSRTP